MHTRVVDRSAVSITSKTGEGTGALREGHAPGSHAAINTDVLDECQHQGEMLMLPSQVSKVSCKPVSNGVISFVSPNSKKKKRPEIRWPGLPMRHTVGACAERVRMERH